MLALPFGRTATIEKVTKIGRDYVYFRTEHGKHRVGRNEKVLIESTD